MTGISTSWYSAVLEALRLWLETLPLAWANSLTMVLFGLLLLMLWSFPRDMILRDAPDQRRWRDLRIWGTLLIFVQLAIYAVFR